MEKHFLMYWKYKTVKDKMASPQPAMMDHSGSDQYDRVKPGDHIWIVTQPEKTSKLVLFGHLRVGRVLNNKDELAKALQRDPATLWSAKYYVISDPYPPEFCDFVDITEIALELRFSGSNDRLAERAWAQSLQTMRTLTPESASLLHERWQTETDSLAVMPVDEPSQEIYPEGRRRLLVHRHYERNKALVSAAKAAFKQENQRLYCEVCGFDFSVYGELGEDFIEAHHRIPLSEIEPTQHMGSSITDLAMVCANCHRMLHRRNPCLSVEALKAILQENKA